MLFIRLGLRRTAILFVGINRWFIVHQNKEIEQAETLPVIADGVVMSKAYQSESSNIFLMPMFWW